MTDYPSAPKLAVLDVMPASSRQVIADFFGTGFDVVHATDDSPLAKRRAASDAVVLLTMWGAVDSATIAAAPRARLIQKLGVGTDKIDIAAAQRQGVVVLKAAGINADAVAELAVLLMLSVTRHLRKAMAAARAGRLEKESLRAESFQLRDKTVGLLGFGHIGQAVARRLAGFGVTLIYHDMHRPPPEVEAECSARYVPADELIATADVISLHLPGTPATGKLIDEAVLARCKPGLILINTARGSLIDEHALAKAIASGHVLGAGLDVAQDEPMPVNSPLLGLDRVIVTPHIGGAVADNFPRVIERAFRNTQAVLSGQPVSPADVVSWPSAPRSGPPPRRNP
jgi:phosphoglycerate dehydrogenase-like enzyme